jgi:hypothetical protein
MTDRRRFVSALLAGAATCGLVVGGAPLPARAANRKGPYTGVWERRPVPGYPKGISGETKHTRWARREVSGDWYVNGGDYRHRGEGENVFDSGSNNTWRVDVRNNVWEKLHSYWPNEGDIVPSHPDETAFVYDSKRDIFWHGGGYQAAPFAPGDDRAHSPIATAVQDRLIYRRWMSFDPKTTRWKDHGPLTLAGRGKFGYYDAAQDKILLPFNSGSSNQFARYDCAADAWVAPVVFGQPQLLDLAENYFACDTRRRRLMFLRESDFAAYCYSLDTGAFGELPGAAPPGKRVSNTYGLTYHAGLDLYALHGGRNATGLLNDLWVVPANGGAWQQVAMSGDGPAPRSNQVLLYDPGLQALISFGGTDGPADSAYFIARLSGSE